jgi:hypothetical protein
VQPARLNSIVKCSQLDASCIWTQRQRLWSLAHGLPAVLVGGCHSGAVITQHPQRRAPRPASPRASVAHLDKSREPGMCAEGRTQGLLAKSDRIPAWASEDNSDGCAPPSLPLARPGTHVERQIPAACCRGCRWDHLLAGSNILPHQSGTSPSSSLQADRVQESNLVSKCACRSASSTAPPVLCAMQQG